MYNNTDLKQYDDAIKSADRLFNQSDKPDFNYLDYYYYGMALRETKQYDLAIVEYKKALDADSTKVDRWKDISDMYNEKSDYKNAISSYNKYLSSLPEEKKNSDAIYELGRLYYTYGNSQADSLSNNKTADIDLRKNALIEADSIFGKVMTLEPTNYRGFIWRARTNFSLDPETTLGLAKPFYEQTLTLVESKADVRYNPVIIECCRYLGYYYYLKKDFIQSKLYWNKILTVDPTNDVATKAIDGINKAMKAKK